MKPIADECVSLPVIAALRDSGHDVVAIRDVAPGGTDGEVLAIALECDCPLVTEDLDFGEMVFRPERDLGRRHHAAPQRAGKCPQGCDLLEVIQEHAEQIRGAFLVITPGAVRIRRVADT